MFILYFLSVLLEYKLHQGKDFIFSPTSIYTSQRLKPALDLQELPK